MSPVRGQGLFKAWCLEPGGQHPPWKTEGMAGTERDRNQGGRFTNL